MASSRIPYSAATVIGSKISAAVQLGARYRAALFELNLECLAYADDNTSFATDSGVASGSAQTFRDLLGKASAEIGALAPDAISVNGLTNSRTFLDRVA